MGSGLAELDEIAVGVDNEKITFAPRSCRRGAFGLDSQLGEFRVRRVEIATVDLDVKRPLLVRQQPEPAVANLQQCESAWHVKHDRCARELAVKLQRTIDVGNVKRYADKRDVHEILSDYFCSNVP